MVKNTCKATEMPPTLYRPLRYFLVSFQEESGKEKQWVVRGNFITIEEGVLGVKVLYTDSQMRQVALFKKWTTLTELPEDYENGSNGSPACSNASCTE